MDAVRLSSDSLDWHSESRNRIASQPLLQTAAKTIAMETQVNGIASCYCLNLYFFYRNILHSIYI